jgi:fatty-acid desaturase
MIAFTNKRFFSLLILSHVALIFLIITGTVVQILSSFLIACAIILFSSTVLYHRFISHRSWKCPDWYNYIFTILGIFSFTGTPLTRTLAHRYHHRYVDSELDPHSPHHMSVLSVYFPMLKEKKLNPMMIRDVLNDKFYMWVHRNYLIIILTVIALSFLLLGPLWAIALFVAPGAMCWFNISLCNVLCHYGTYGVKNNKLLSFLTFGEGNHKHHHDLPLDPDFSDGGFDLGYLIIRKIQKW